MEKHYVIVINFKNLGQLECTLDSITVDHNTINNDAASHRLGDLIEMTIESNLNYNSNFLVDVPLEMPLKDTFSFNFILHYRLEGKPHTKTAHLSYLNNYFYIAQ